MRFESENASECVLRPGLCSTPCWGAYSTPADPLAGFGWGKGIGKDRGGKGSWWEWEREGKPVEGYWGRGREERGEERMKSNPLNKNSVCCLATVRLCMLNHSVECSECVLNERIPLQTVVQPTLIPRPSSVGQFHWLCRLCILLAV